MFQFNDDFDFDELDNVTTESDNSNNLDEHNSSHKTDIHDSPIHLSNIHPVHVNYKVQSNVTNKSKEFLNIWKNKCENQNILGNLKRSLPAQELTTRHVKVIRERKFPGPAGLLPVRQGNTSFIATEEFLHELTEENDETSEFKENDVLSQNSERIFESGAWNVMVEDLGRSVKALISLMNLASLRLKHTKGYKVPFLAVIINNIDCTLPDPTLVVKDLTDEMHGMLHREVWEKFNAEMLPGSVLVLKNVGVISAGTSSRRHVLNITTNNLTAIYSNRQENNIQIRKISEFSSSDHSRMLNEWEKIVSRPNALLEIPKNSLIKASKSNVELNTTAVHPFKSKSAINTFSPRNPIKQCDNRQQLKTNHNSEVNIIAKNKSLSEQPFKKRKSELNTSSGVVIKDRKGTLQNKPFQINSDTSLVDSLLDGIDTNSLFEEF